MEEWHGRPAREITRKMRVPRQRSRGLVETFPSTSYHSRLITSLVYASAIKRIRFFRGGLYEIQ